MPESESRHKKDIDSLDGVQSEALPWLKAYGHDI